VRWYPSLIVVFWLASLVWLTSTKLLPPLRTGDPPKYEDILPDRAVTLPPVVWAIELNGRPLGTARNEVTRHADGHGRVRSQVQIDGLSLQDVLQPSFGMLGTALQRALGLGPASTGSGPTLDLDVRNEMHFDAFGQLQKFDCRVDVAELDEWIQLEGIVHETRLRVSASIGIEDSDAEEPSSSTPAYQTEVELPTDRMVADALSPRPRFGRLRVGQSWTFQMYRPLLPNRPLDLVEATVEGYEEIAWCGQTVPALHVVYRRAAGSTLSLDRELGSLWVLSDGTVVRQTLHWGSLQLTFHRQPPEDARRQGHPSDTAETVK
jgi:hypothetical protein